MRIKLLIIAAFVLSLGLLVADAAPWPQASPDAEPQEAYITFTGLSAFPGLQFAVFQPVGEYGDDESDYNYKEYYRVTWAQGDAVTVRFWGNQDVTSYPPYLTCDPALKKRPGRTVIKQRRMNIAIPDWENENTPYTMHVYTDAVPAGYQRTDIYYKVLPVDPDPRSGPIFRLEQEKVVFRHSDFTITSTHGMDALAEYGWENNFDYERLIGADAVPALLAWAKAQPGFTVEQGTPGKADTPKRKYYVPLHGAVSTRVFSIGLSVLAALTVVILFVVVMSRRK